MGAHVDVMIIGGGAAGASAALRLAQLGFSSMVIARENRSIYADIESIGSEIIEVLAELGIAESIDGMIKGRYEKFYSDQQLIQGVSARSPYGYHIFRGELDRFLLKQLSLNSVVTLRPGIVVDVENGEKPSVLLKDKCLLNTSFIIDCSGKNRVVGKSFGQRELIYSPQLTAWSGIGYCDALVEDTGCIPRWTPTITGWTWLAPLTNGQVAWTCLAGTRQGIVYPQELSPHTGRRLRSANVTWRRFDKLAGSGFLLAGEAAGVLDPGTGHGLLKAMYSGIYAADTVARIFHRRSSINFLLEEYHEVLTHAFEHDARVLNGHYRRVGWMFD